MLLSYVKCEINPGQKHGDFKGRKKERGGGDGTPGESPQLKNPNSVKMAELPEKGLIKSYGA